MRLLRNQPQRLDDRRPQNTDDRAAQVRFHNRCMISQKIESLAQHHQRNHAADQACRKTVHIHTDHHQRQDA